MFISRRMFSGLVCGGGFGERDLAMEKAKLKDGGTVSGENPFANHTDAQLINESGMKHPGYIIESMRRLRNAVETQTRAVERQSRASGFLTWTIIALMVVQILYAVAQILAAVVKVGR